MNHTKTTTHNLSNDAFVLYDRPGYFDDLTKRIRKLASDDKVLLMAMLFDPTSPAIAALLETLCSAAQRGVSVTLVIDASTFLQADNGKLGPLFYGQPLGATSKLPFSAAFEALERLKQSGGQYTITNQPRRRFTVPSSGRSHIKLGLINDQIYIGGVNLDNATHVDIMVGWSNAQSANWLWGIAEAIAATGNVQQALGAQDLTFSIDQKTRLYLDVGKRHQSIIFKNALSVIDRAEQLVVISCQFFPNSLTAQHLKRQFKHGVLVTILFNSPAKLSWLHHVNMWIERRQLPRELFSRQLPAESAYLHAKVIATEKESVIGSHNYITAGVHLGTAEIALFRLDSTFANSVRRKLDRIVEIT